MVLSLRHRILWWSVASTLVIALAIFVFVDGALRSTIRSDLVESVAGGVPFAVALHEAEVGRLLDRTVAMALEPTLRAAVETGDGATIAGILGPFLRGFNIEWLAVTTPTGEIMAATTSAPIDRIRGAGKLLAEALYYDTGDLWLEEEALVQVQASGVLVGGVMAAVLVSGAPVGRDLVGRLQMATRQRIFLRAQGRLLAGADDVPVEFRTRFVEAWGRSDLEPPAGAEGQVGLDSLEEIVVEGQGYLGSVIPLLDGSGKQAAQLVVYRSLTEALRPARLMRLALSGITGVGVVLALILSASLSTGVTMPVERLVRETVRLGSGDLDHRIVPERDDEIGALARAFDQMRVSLKQARGELIRAERMSGVGSAASAIIHDFTGPLTMINFHAHELSLDWADEKARAAGIAGIQGEVVRLDAMMLEILEFGRGVESLDQTKGSVHDLLNAVALETRQAMSERGIVLDVQHGYGGMWVLDFRRTGRVLENLIRNSVSAVGREGTVRLSSSHSEEGLCLKVEDDGPGIPEDLHETLFDPWVTHGKEGGTGLGLAIARSFTEAQDGAIRFETSELGTSFVLEFPPCEELV